MNPLAATVTPPPRTATDTPPPRSALTIAPDPIRRRTWLAGVALVVLLIVNLPAVMRTALDCDPILFDLFLRDMGRGRVLYREMLENNTPAMIALHAVIRGALGWSFEALRAVDLLVVGAGIGLLANWFHPGRPDRKLFAACLLAALYLSTTEWCHAQRDVWVLLPVMGGLNLRRAAVAGGPGNLTPRPPLRCGEGVFKLDFSPANPVAPGQGRVEHPLSASERGTGGEVTPPARIGRSLLEGVVWGIAVWLKPHMMLVGLAVWLVGVALARDRRITWRAIGLDLAGLVGGGLLTGAAGIAGMMAAGVWWPYLDHLFAWAGEYPGADMYGPYGRWLFRLAAVIRNLPWSVVYLMALPAAVVATAGPVVARLRGRPIGRPELPLLGTALSAWAAQALCLQHIFDYVHIGGELMAFALLAAIAADRPTARGRRFWLGLLAVVAAGGHLPLAVSRLPEWADCVMNPSTPARYHRLGQYDRIAWEELLPAVEYLKQQDVKDGELCMLSDTGLPAYSLTGVIPTSRYYIPRNNMLCYKSRHPEILAELAAAPHQRFVLVNLAGLRWTPPPGQTWKTPGDWPLTPDWKGPNRWADKVAFRNGRYLVLAMPAADVPAFLADVSEF